MKRHIVTIMFVLFVMGCTQQAQEKEENTITYNGVVITSLVPGISSLMPLESTELTMIIQNKGDFEATQLKTKLLGLGQIVPNPVNEENWPAKISPEDREEYVWDLTAPSLSGFNSEIPFTIQGIVYFHYSSVSWADAAFVPEGESNQPIKENGTSSSPISITLSTNPEIIRTYRDSTPFSIKINIENKGGGSIAYYEDGSENSEKSNYMETIRIKVPSDWEIMDESWKEQTTEEGFTIYIKTIEETTVTQTITDCSICGCPEEYTLVDGSCLTCQEGFLLDIENKNCFKEYCDQAHYELVSRFCCPSGWDYNKLSNKCEYNNPETGKEETDPISPKQETTSAQTTACKCHQQKDIEGNFDSQLRLTGGSTKTIYVPFNVNKVNNPKIQRFYVNASYGYKVSSPTTTIIVMPNNY